VSSHLRSGVEHGVFAVVPSGALNADDSAERQHDGIGCRDALANAGAGRRSTTLAVRRRDERRRAACRRRTRRWPVTGARLAGQRNCHQRNSSPANDARSAPFARDIAQVLDSERERAL